MLNYSEKEEQTRYEEEENKIRNENSLIDYGKLERLIDLKNRDIRELSFLMPGTRAEGNCPGFENSSS